MPNDAPNYQYPDNIARVAGDIGNEVLAVRRDAAGTISTADGHYGPLQIDASGNLRTILPSSFKPSGGSTAVRVTNTTAARVPGRVTQDGAPWSFTSTAVNIIDRSSRQVGLVDVRKATTASAPARTVVSSTAGIKLASNSARRSFIIQNVGTLVVKLAFGGTNPTSTKYHVALASGSAADDGTGAVYMDDQWTGDVRAFSATTAGRLVITEIT